MKHLGTIKLSTSRLILRRMKESDAEGIFNSFVNDKAFLYYANKEPRTLDQEKDSLKGIDQKYQNKEYYNWLITLKDNTIIGCIYLRVDNNEDSLEFNYAIWEKYQKNGYMTEALKTIKDFSLNKLNVKKFFGGCEIHNIASSRVMEKCGLIYEKTITNYLKLKDGYHDMLVYSNIVNLDK
ncbi:GNAT family N-acetyltransferase [bacterium]|nr:GNAT family N-acetyltransferase [bacterium]